jgi:hypothetical protein
MSPPLKSFIFLACGLLLGANAMAIEEPKFEVLSQEGNIELRQYPAFIVAETTVEGDMSEASNKGFRAIADFIFGNNQMRAGSGEASSKIAMTAPVTIEPVPASQKIAMTAPVTVEAQPFAAPNVQGAQRWRVHFVMPSQYTLATLPTPVNQAVTLREVPAKTQAVLTYSGFNTEARVQERTDELLAWLGARKFQTLGRPQLARYDPPWTLPMFRRNEILVEIARP